MSAALYLLLVPHAFGATGGVSSLRSVDPFEMSEGRRGSDEEDRDSLTRATVAMRAAIPAAEADPSRPAFHFRAPAQWMNDPNGTIFYRGWYHVFYQLNPYGDQWENMHWGHARSRDLVHWEHLPIALWPSKFRGEDHVFSGSTFVVGGKPVIYYTSIGGRAPEQWAATPLDASLFRWRKSPDNPIVTTQNHHPVAIHEWRDPFLFEHAGRTYMVTGGAHEGRGVVVLHRAKDPELAQWEYVGILFRHRDAGLIECPNIVKLGRKWVLLVSAHGRVEAFVGRLDASPMQFVSERQSVLADGSYASQLLTDERGRCIHLAWLRTTDRRGWNGCLTLPSVLRLRADGTLLRQPIAALEKLRGRRVSLANVSLQGTHDLSKQVPGDLLEILAEIDPGTASTIHLRLHGATLTYDVQTRTLTTPNRTPVVLRDTVGGRNLKLHLFLDHSVLDVYADGGAVTQTSALSASPEDTRVQISAEGGSARIAAMTVYTLKPAKFDLKRFR